MIIKKIHILYLFRGGVLIYAVHCMSATVCIAFIAPSRTASPVRLPLGLSSRTEWAGELVKEVCVFVCVVFSSILYIMRTKCLQKYSNTSNLCVGHNCWTIVSNAGLYTV